MAIIKSFAPFLNLSNYQTFLVDDNPNSDYFRITEFKETFTGGKNGFLIEGSPFLRETTEVKIEILDVEGNPIYFEPGDGVPEYYEGTSKLIAVHVYDDTPIGVGKITILGELKNYVDGNGSTLPIPPEWKDVYNVKWEKTFKINKNLNNEDTVRFYKRPIVSINELVKPIFSKTVSTVTDSGSVTGISQFPLAGTDLTNYRAGTFYKLIRSSGSWDKDVDENIIELSGLNYSPRIIEVLNDREVLVDTPYVVNNIVTNFASQSYSITYADFQNQIISESELTGSFAKIDITNLKTFVGDVARVKVFRKSRNAVGDFQFVQESKLESTELLRDITTTQDTELSYGRFDEYNLETYWVTESVSHPTTIDSSVLSQAVKVDYNGSGIQKLITSQSFSLSKDVEYTLGFRTLLSGSVSSDKYLKAYFSGSFLNGLGNETPFTQSFVDITANSTYLTRQNVSQNILAERDIDAKLVFEFKGDDWYISNVSLKNAQDTSFSPDEFTLIQDIPRKLASETFDFRFEFYDINNNYIPVDVNASAVFDGGNDFPTSGKLLTFESDRNAFRFSSGSIANPAFQQIQFKVTSQNLTGSVTFASSAFDVDGNYIDPLSYTGDYPGLLTNVTPAGAIITISNFSGSDESYTVGSIIYTASLGELEEYETVYRLEDGDNAPQLIVTSNANQFIYEPTTLSPKPSGQSITIRAQRKNLASLITPIEVNSGSNRPGLTYVDTVGGIDTYTISATEFSASFAQNNFDEVTYSFTGSDVFGNQQADEITLSKVINFDGVSLVLSNESTTFPANSTGDVIGGFAASSGSVQMFIGGNQILHDDASGGRLKNTFDITSIVGSGVTPTSTSPTNQYYSISAMPYDSGSLTLNIEYLAGDNSTTQEFQKVVSYTKAKKGVPTILTKASPASQTINSSSAEFEDPQNVEVFVMEGGDEYTYTAGSLVGNNKFKIISIVSGSDVSTEGAQSGSISPTKSPYGTNGSALVSYVNSEGTLVENKTIRFDVGISKVGKDGINGSSGSDAQVVSLSANQYTIPYDGDGNEIGTNTITLTATAKNFENPEYRFLKDGSVKLVGGVEWSSTSTYVIDNADEPGVSDVNLWEVQVRESGDTYDGVFDNIDIFGLKDGSDSFTVFLTNEAHTFAANSDGVITSTLSDGATEVRFFRGTTQYTYATSGLNTYSVSAISSSIQLAQSTVSSQRKFTPTSVSGDAGTATITITDNNTSNQFVKTYTFTRSKKGAPVATILANPQAQTVVSSSLSGIGTPSNVTIVVNEGGSNYSYDNSSPYGNSTFRITGVTNGTNNNNGTITPTTPTDSTPINGVVTLSYVNSEGTSFTGKTVNFNVGVVGVGTDGAPGAPGPSGSQGEQGGDGPGVVFRGPWSSSTTYYDTDDYPTRRDAVLYNGTYYATKTNPVTNLNKQPDTQTTFWESLGTDDFFVAAKIAIFEESYVQNTINVGTNTSGNANITIYGGDASPYISVGQPTKGYGLTGAWIGSDGTSGKLSLVNGTTSYLKWNGTGLDIKGDIIITGGSGIASLSDAGAFATLDEATLSLISDAGAMAGIDSITTSNASTYIGAGAITTGFIAANAIVADKIAANAVTANAITASAITTAKLATDAIKSTNYNYTSGTYSTAGTFLDLSNGAITAQNFAISSAGTANFRGTINAGDATLGPDVVGTYDGLKIDANNYWVTGGSPQFRVGDATSRFVYDTGLGIALISDTSYGGFKIYADIAGSPNNKTSMTYNRFEVSPAVESNTSTNWGYFSTGGMTMKCNSIAQRNYFDLSTGHDLYISGGPLIVGDDITATGNITAFGSSDRRLKDNIVPISNALQKIIKIGGYEFDWNENQKSYKGHDIGVIAQEIQEVLPEVVQEKEDGYLGVRYEKIVPLLIEGIKELANKVESLEQEILKLKEKK